MEPAAQRYGLDRFGRNEGFNGQLSTLYKLNAGKRWWRRKIEAELDTNMVFAIICSLSIHGLRWEGRRSPPMSNSQARQARIALRWMRGAGGAPVRRAA